MLLINCSYLHIYISYIYSGLKRDLILKITNLYEKGHSVLPDTVCAELSMYLGNLF